MESAEIVWLGTREGAPWHPLGAVEAEARACVTGLGTLEVTDDVGRLKDLAGVRLLICCADLWETALDDEATGGLLAYAASGGGVLVIHNGICFQNRPEFQALVGARFTGHPDAGPLEFRPSSPDHPICLAQPRGWILEDEPYRFERHGVSAATLLYEYFHDGAWHPAAWTSKFGRGRVVYLMPGHSAASFRHPDYASVVSSAAAWLAAGFPE